MKRNITSASESQNSTTARAFDPTVAQALPRYLEVRAARFIDWQADGAMLVATRFGEDE